VRKSLAGIAAVASVVALLGCGDDSDDRGDHSGTTTIKVAGGSMSFAVPAGLREVDCERPEGAPIPITAATLRLDSDNVVELIEFRLDEPQPAPTDGSLRRDLAEAFAAGDLATGFDVEAEGHRATQADGVPGITLSAQPEDSAAADDVRVDYDVYLRERDLYAIRCQSTPAHEDEIPEGREEEWRRALRLEAGVLVPTVRDALKATRRGDGERVSAKLNGLGVVIGDLKGLYADVGLKICSA